VASIVSVAIIVWVGWFELGVQGETPDGYAKRQEEDDRKEASHHPTHMRILARSPGAHLGAPASQRLQIMISVDANERSNGLERARADSRYLRDVVNRRERPVLRSERHHIGCGLQADHGQC
jgi:hypothetical protein